MRKHNCVARKSEIGSQTSLQKCQGGPKGGQKCLPRASGIIEGCAGGVFKVLRTYRRAQWFESELLVQTVEKHTKIHHRNLQNELPSCLGTALEGEIRSSDDFERPGRHLEGSQRVPETSQERILEAQERPRTPNRAPRDSHKRSRAAKTDAKTSSDCVSDGKSRFAEKSSFS